MAESPLQQRLGPCADPEGFEWSEFGGRWRDAHQVGSSERPHDQNAETELAGQWQQAVLYLAFARVVRDLDGVEATGDHRGLQLVEARSLPVRRADERDL